MPQTTLYEPRAYWSIGRVTPTILNVPTELLLNREHFRNGTRHPIELDHMLLGMVGYTFDSYPGANDPPIGAGDVDASTQAMERLKVSVISPSRYACGIDPIPMAALVGQQTRDVSMRNDPLFGYATGLHHVCRWDFKRPMVIPRGGSLEFGLGAPQYQPLAVAGVGDLDTRPTFTIAFEEEFGKGGGSARSVEGVLSWFGPGSNLHPYGAPPDGLLTAVPPDPAPGSVVYDPAAVFSSAQWRRQQGTQSGSTKVTGFAVAIDQIAWEDAVQASPPANGIGEPLASLALRTPTRAPFMTDGGSKMEWWRQDAPLALVCPSMTPAKVVRLPRPIILAPGDALDVLLEFPGGFPGSPSDPVIETPYQVGVSFTGYAHIEG